VIIDVAAPLIAYSLLRSAGMSTVTALVLSGVFPALGVAIGVIRHRRLRGTPAAGASGPRLEPDHVARGRAHLGCFPALAGPAPQLFLARALRPRRSSDMLTEWT
jgi:hypothetical protein